LSHIDPSKHPHAQELAENEASINQVLGRSPAFPVGLLKCNMTQTFFVFKTKEGVLKQKMAIVMDLQQGVDFLVFCEEIRDRKRPRISLGNILLIFENMINEIICLHSLGILHRDIKLDSFVFDETTFKVIDFDLSVQTKNNIYQSNFGLGTEDYLAPELQNSFFQAFFPQQWFKNKVYKYNEKTEAYALGMCFYVAFENIANVSQNHPIFLKIRQLHEAMRQKDANQRPSLKEVLKSVKKLQEENNAFEARMNKPGQSSSLAQGVASRGSPGK
jgi:serine/threonine protein kinase